MEKMWAFGEQLEMCSVKTHERSSEVRTRTSRSVVDVEFEQAAAAVRNLSAAVVQRQPIRRGFEITEGILSSLPINPNDFLAARSRLRHAKRLTLHGEIQAASKELLLLADCLYENA